MNRTLSEKSTLSARAVLNELIFLFFCGLILSIPALINGFPLVTSDSGTYIGSGFRLHVPIDRPIVYSFFIRHLSLHETFWLVIIAQGSILAWLISKVSKIIIPDYNNYLHRLIILIILSLFSSVSWYTSQLMPDIFAAYCILCYIIILFTNNSSAFSKVFVPILLCFSIMTHNSHMLTGTIILICLLFWGIIFKRFQKYEISRRKFLFLGSIILSGWLISPTINLLVDGKFRLAGSPHVFLMGRLSETGILKAYLDENCNSVKNAKEISVGHEFTINGKTNQKCITGSGKDNLKMFEFKSNRSQLYSFIHLSDSTFKILNTGSHQFITIDSNVIEKPGVGLHEDIETDRNSQKFYLSKVGKDYFKIGSIELKKVFDIADNNMENGAALILTQDLNNDNQKFRLLSDTNCKLCFFKDRLPNNAMTFLWGDESILNRTGGWENSEKEYNKIIMGTLSKPRLLIWHFRAAIVATLRQLISNDVGDGLGGHNNGSAPYMTINSNLSKELPALTASKEFNGYMNCENANKRIFEGLMFSMIILLLFYFRKIRSTYFIKIWPILVIILSGLIVNAFVTASFANVLARLQSRVSWLFFFMALLIIYEPIIIIIKNLKSRLTGRCE